MELMTLEAGVEHTCWNASGVKMAAGMSDGSIQIYEPDKGASSDFLCTSKWKAHEGAVVKLVWGPQEYGDLLACCSRDGTMSVWEEIEDKDKEDVWSLCHRFTDIGVPVLDIAFGNCVSGLKLVAAGGDGHLRVYEASNVLELKNWQLQAEFANVTDVVEKLETVSCTAASISWRPAADAIQQPVFVVGFQTNSPQHSIAKVWEFGEAHQRWHLVAELTSPDHDYGRINHVSWAPNIGRPYELIAISSSISVSIWSMEIPSIAGRRPAVQLLGYFTDHEGGVLQAKWDMSGMTLASAGCDGLVKLWQSNLKGKWEEKSSIVGTQH
ncbi:nucleoporin SEH1 [Marchantia polymorpha subsp. ruderalis]|uniref:Anaphase-promoting complex subunit 4 WD40 domain-containing protein n=2 Tax=Marchantia polymorpha TaxID=3197 RepID=A0AAF6BJ69_MARPO|nr:hypothetical protein MARPO_0117s0010 [Marchantia polymorpha]BBN12053.1 hypothetical protein Mp_5g16960 [Marchantia polymorpha subsp. ruderalis]|eukprot:PTQ30930.1 hypothetical protein MARPO_0117s0010 [Marchantia polymorpha]